MVIVKFKGKEYKFKYTQDEKVVLNTSGGIEFLNNIVESKNQNVLAIILSSIILAGYVPDTGKKNYISTIQFQNTACYRHLWKTLALDAKICEKFMKYVASPRAKFVLELTEKKKK